MRICDCCIFRILPHFFADFSKVRISHIFPHKVALFDVNVSIFCVSVTYFCYVLLLDHLVAILSEPLWNEMG